MPDPTPEWAAKAAMEILANARGKEQCDFCGKPSIDDIAAIIKRCAEEEIERVAQGFILALNESVKLQSHYADILNMHDGGRRILFKTADEWMRRLAEARNRP